MWDPLKYLYGKRHIVDHSNVPYGVISDHDSDSTYVPTDEEDFFKIICSVSQCYQIIIFVVKGQTCVGYVCFQ